MRDPRAMTLLESLESAAKRSDRGIRTFDDDYTPSFDSFEDVMNRAQAIAAGLQARGLKKGDRVSIILLSPKDFLPAFYGVQYAGGVPIPMYGPTSMARIQSFIDVAIHILSAGKAKFMITEGDLVEMGKPLVPFVEGMEDLLDIHEIAGDQGDFKRVDVAIDDIAFLQFTSGSTSKPKGVQLTHSCLQANVEVIRRYGVGLHDEDVPVSWLPLFHDMGLIGFHFTPMVQQITINYLTPVQFIMRPKMWLKLITDYRGTISFSPNFGFGYAAKRIKESDVSELDLSSWRIAGCGAEPIKVETLQTFFDKFKPAGFNHRIVVPCYGLAEFSLAASFCPMTRGIRTDTVDPDILADERRAVPTSKDDGGVTFVGCGYQVPGHTLEIIDEQGNVLPDRHVGEIRLKGPSRAKGYEGIEEGEGAFRDGYLYTGDLGYMAAHELFVCGRSKEIIKSRGRTYYPQDIEWATAQVEGVRFGAVAAFGVPGAEGTELIVVVVERAKGTDIPERKLKSAIRREVGDGVGILIDRVVVGGKGAISKTSSGKIQRTKIRKRYMKGEFGELGKDDIALDANWDKLNSAGKEEES